MPIVDDVDAPHIRINRVDALYYEHITVRIVVIQEHGEDARARGSRAELVGESDRGQLILLVFRGGVEVVLLYLALILLLGDQLVPVVDRLTFGLNRPDAARARITQHHARPIRGELESRGVSRNIGEGHAPARSRHGPLDLGGGSRVALPPSDTRRPCRVGASRTDERRHRDTLDPGCKIGRRPAAQRHRQKAAVIRHQHPIAVVRRRLQHAAARVRQLIAEVHSGPLDRHHTLRRVEKYPSIRDGGDADFSPRRPENHIGCRLRRGVSRRGVDAKHSVGLLRVHEENALGRDARDGIRTERQ